MSSLLSTLWYWFRRHPQIWITAAVALYLGWGIRGCVVPTIAPQSHKNHTHASSPKRAAPTVWTCSMHPQIKLPKKGKCPICFMDLIPLKTGGDAQRPRQLVLSKTAEALAGLATTKVRRHPVHKHLRVTGRVTYDETRVKTITAWVEGRLERLFVDYTGVPVRKGDHLIQIYSPSLLAAQEELLQALKARDVAAKRGKKRLGYRLAAQSVLAARKKLSLLGLKSWQLKEIERRRKASVRTNIYAPLGGIVIHKKALEGMYVKTGSPIYTIADLSQVWVQFDAYERNIAELRVGQDVYFTALAAPGQRFHGQIIYIDPVLAPHTRTVKVRVNVANKAGKLKPGLFVRGIVEVSLNEKGEAQAPIRPGRWTCPMHPEILRGRPGRCPLCRMRLERTKKVKRNPLQQQDPLVIPASAPLFSGRQAVVYIKRTDTTAPTYEGRVVTLGPRAGAHYVVLRGLKAGEQVVTHGAFKLDSELQIRAKPSMMTQPSAPNTRTTPLQRKLSDAYYTQQKKLYKAYFALQQALVEDKAKPAQSAFRKLYVLLRRPKRLTGADQIQWQLLRAALLDAAKRGRRLQEIKLQRRLFETFSKVLLRLQRQVGHKGGQPVYHAYCPMAFDNKGASWLQPKKKLLNPYFGASMLSCGEVKKTFTPVSSSTKKPRRHPSKRRRATKRSSTP